MSFAVNKTLSFRTGYSLDIPLVKGELSKGLCFALGSDNIPGGSFLDRHTDAFERTFD
jgi:hypothetical protein